MSRGGSEAGASEAGECDVAPKVEPTMDGDSILAGNVPVHDRVAAPGACKSGPTESEGLGGSVWESQSGAQTTQSQTRTVSRGSRACTLL